LIKGAGRKTEKRKLLETCLNNFHANLKALRSELRTESRETNSEVQGESFWLSGLQGLYFRIWPTFQIFFHSSLCFFFGQLPYSTLIKMHCNLCVQYAFTWRWW